MRFSFGDALFVNQLAWRLAAGIAAAAALLAVVLTSETRPQPVPGTAVRADAPGPATEGPPLPAGAEAAPAAPSAPADGPVVTQMSHM
jgi:hypothetical protein